MSDPYEFQHIATVAPRMEVVPIVGIGGAAGAALAHIASECPDKQDIYLLDSDLGNPHLFEKSGVDLGFVGRDILRGLGAGGDEVCGEHAMASSVGVFEPIFNNAGAVIVIAGLGGGLGSGGTPVFLEEAKKRGVMTFSLLMTPFQSEGEARPERAQRALAAISAQSDGVACFCNQRSADGGHAEQTVFDSFSFTDFAVAHCACSIRQMLTQPSSIPVEPAKILRAIAPDTSNKDYWVASAWAKGASRVHEAINQIVHFPMFSDTAGRLQAQDALIFVTGGKDLSLQDIDVVRSIEQQLGPQTHAVIGVATDERFDSLIRISVIAVKRSKPAKTVEPQKGNKKVNGGKSPVKQPDLFESGTDPTPGLGGDRFDGVEATYYHDLNLDEPTYMNRRPVRIRQVI